MTRLFYAFLALLLLAPVSTFAQEEAKDIETASKITAATVYSDRAKVTRVAVVDIPAGAHTVVFTGLPPSLMPDSLRAEGKARAEVKFGAVSHKQVMSSELTSERERELNDKSETIQDQITALNAERAAIEAQKTFISQIGQQAQLRSGEEIAEINLKPEQWAAAAATIRTNIAEASKALLEIDIRNRTLSREQQRVLNELSTLRTGGRSTYSVSIPVETASATSLTVELSYQVPDATWQPLYDARLSTEGKGELKLTQFGAVSQRTGEDWTGIT
ncbi:MAG: putative mucoidy inhibitor, partial [Alphaproteobacteria bacterium]|nr:putative mucoidy inhibitor [Alphaproteobacteria bacterium]